MVVIEVVGELLLPDEVRRVPAVPFLHRVRQREAQLGGPGAGVGGRTPARAHGADSAGTGVGWYVPKTHTLPSGSSAAYWWLPNGVSARRVWMSAPLATARS